MEDIKLIIESKICPACRQHVIFNGFNKKNKPIIEACCTNFHNKIYGEFGKYIINYISEYYDEIVVAFAPKKNKTIRRKRFHNHLVPIHS